MLFKEIIAVYIESSTKPTNTFCEQKEEFMILKQALHIVTTGL
jgi:hypothetical protein